VCRTGCWHGELRISAIHLPHTYDTLSPHTRYTFPHTIFSLAHDTLPTQTLSTLRYADRAKQIKNQVRINEDPKDARLRELKEEREKLMAALAAANGGPIDLDGAAITNTDAYTCATGLITATGGPSPSRLTKFIQQHTILSNHFILSFFAPS